MKGFFVMLSVFIVLIIFVFCQELYIVKVSRELSKDLDWHMISSGEDLKDIIKKWDEAEKKLNLFINQKELEKITIELKTTEVLYNCGEEALFKAYLERVKIKIENLPKY